MSDLNRVKQLAGITSSVEDQLYTTLSEYVDLSGDLSIEQLQSRLDACKRALGIANTLPDKADRKKWVIAVFVNMNKIRTALQRLISKMDEQ